MPDPAQDPVDQHGADGASSPDPLGHLLPHHAAQLRASGISPEVALERGYRSVTSRADLERLGFAKNQRIVPTLVVPIRDVHGEIRNYQSRPDVPRIHDGKAVKYETPKGSQMLLDVPKRVRAMLGDPTLPLWITEGCKKADASATFGLCCIALLGVWNFRGTNEHGGKTALPDWESIALNERIVYIVFDSDVTTKPGVRMALFRLKPFLESRGARVRVVLLPGGPSGAKVGLDDFLVAGGTVDRLVELSVAEVPASDDPPEPETPYVATEQGMFWRRETGDGIVLVPLTNFSAAIVEEVVRDDGAETTQSFLIEVKCGGRTDTRSVTAAEFGAMAWVTEKFGAGAVVFAGHGLRDHTRAAIQLLSGDRRHRDVYAHTGWREVHKHWVYLHAAGAIGADGAVADVSVDLDPALALMKLPDPPAGEELKRAVRASLTLADLGKRDLGVVFLAVAHRAPLGASDFSVHLAGTTGVFKTECGALIVQHFGPGQDSRNCAASWSSTANANEALAFCAKDAPLLVDDFAPGGSGTDVQKTHRDADRLLRAQGNSSGRRRLNADGSSRPVRAPRGLIVSTGEDVPNGQSLRARVLIVEVGPGDVDLRRLTDAQKVAADGELAAATSAYIQWLAADLDGHRRRFKDDARLLRDALQKDDAHRRTGGIAAELIASSDMYFDFAEEVGAIDSDQAEVLRQRVRSAFRALAARQVQHQVSAEPAARFVALLSSSILSGGSHLLSAAAERPDTPTRYGWRSREIRMNSSDTEVTWDPCGKCVGWVDGDDVYLDPDAAYAAAQLLGKDTGTPLSVMGPMLNKRLHEQGYLVSTDTKSATLTVRKKLGGSQRRVLRLRTNDLVPAPDADANDAAGGASRDRDDDLFPSTSAETAPSRTTSSGCGG